MLPVGVLQSQIPLGQWRDHFSFSEASRVCFHGSTVFCASANGILSYNPETGEIGKYTRVNGLSDVGISALAVNQTGTITAIGYTNGNVDLRLEDELINLPDIKHKSIPGGKTINGFTFHNGYVYVATDFGVVVIDPEKREIKDTYYLGSQGGAVSVFALAVYDGNFWAATSQGLFYASVDDPLLISSEHWHQAPVFGSPSEGCSDVVAVGNVLFAAEKLSAGNDILWRYDGYQWTEVDRPFSHIARLGCANAALMVTSDEGVARYTDNGQLVGMLTNYTFNSVFQPGHAIALDERQFAIADRFNGLVIGTFSEQYNVRPNAPTSMGSFAADVSAEMVVVAAGAYDAAYSNIWNPFWVHSFESEKWSDFTDWSGHDAVAVRFNPKNPVDYFVASWGHGLYRFNGASLAAHFTPDNSTLQSVFPGAPYCRISGLDFDDDGNLWLANPEVANPISVLTAEGSWFSFPYATAIGSQRLGKLCYYSATGTLWLILPGGGGLFVLDPGVRTDSKDDDRFRRFSPADANGTSFGVAIYDLLFDNDGTLWLGTNRGVLVSYNPDRVFDYDCSFQRIKIPDVVEGLAVYLLETEEVIAVELDGGNRKWFGTEKSGAYLFGSDGTTQLLHFTTDNSPLPSNTILDIKVHPTTGEVFFITDKGVVSYRGDATQPVHSYDKAYVFPNPVRPDYSGTITITGLLENTRVKITDLSGNLVYETRSAGGTATWDGKSFNGKRVASGVYLIFCSDQTGRQATVLKLLFIN